MISIKISTSSAIPIGRQLTKELSRKYIFYINQNKNIAVDYWFILDDLKLPEISQCKKDNIYLCIGEPSSVKKYSKLYIMQFGGVITCQTNLNHKNVISSFPLLPWFSGLCYDSSTGDLSVENTSIIKIQKNVSCKKLNKVVIIISNKRVTDGQRKRVDFVIQLKKDLGENLDVFGNGFKPVADKFEILTKYKYSLVIENSVEFNYWSEKLADSYLSETYPIYYGCPNIFDYFSSSSISIIDIDKYGESLQRINTLLETSVFDKNYQNVKRSKEKILNNYNIFNIIDDVVSSKKNTRDKRRLQLIFPNIIGPRSILKVLKVIAKKLLCI